MKLLKEQDFASYVDLIKNTKNTRILDLLKSTDNYLKQLGAKIMVQKGENPSFNQDEELSQQDSVKCSYSLTT